MKRFFENQFLVALIVYIFIVGLVTALLFGYFQKIKQINEQEKQQLGIYQNLEVKDNRFLKSSGKTSCSGNFFFQAGSPVTAIGVKASSLYISQTEGKLAVVDLVKSGQAAEFVVPVLSDLYIDAGGIYGADFFNDRVVKLSFEKDNIAIENVYPKIGRPSALVRAQNYFYVSGYASGNITKIVGRDGFLYLSDLERIVDIEASDAGRLLVARYGAKPALLMINLDDNEQTAILQQGSVSSLTFDGSSFWAAFDQAGQSEIARIVNEGLIDNQILDCPFPVKIAVWQDKIFYTSLVDSEGKIYWINKNLQKNGK